MMNQMEINTGGAYGKLFVIPQDISDREFLLAVDRRARDVVYRRFGILLDYDWQANTITNMVFETAISHLAFILKSENCEGVGFDFIGLFKATATIKRNDKAEKEGNINIAFEPGEKVISLIENGPDDTEFPEGNKLNPEAFFKTGNKQDDQFYETIDYHTRYNLSIKNGILLRDTQKFVAFAIAYTFIESLYTELIYRLVNSEEKEKDLLISVNFNDNLEIHGRMVDGHIDIIMRPGVGAKLLIKCDEVTEHTMGDLE